MANANTTSTPKRRGRKGGAKVPCDDCIIRASKKADKNASLELCDRCTAILCRPKKKPEPSAAKNPRRRTDPRINSILPTASAAFEVPWSDDKREHRALQFFVQTSAPQLAGYFDSPFWQRMVLQAGRNEPSIKHAIAAIGALHETLLTNGLDTEESQLQSNHFALEQCNKSIQHLIKPAKEGQTPDLRLMLTTCVLFTCFEALQGHCEQAINHAAQGYSLVQQYVMDPNNHKRDLGAFAVELDQLTMLMRRLQTQAKCLMGKEYNIIPDAEALDKAKKPTEFTTLNEARCGLEVIVNQMTVFFIDMEQEDKYYDLKVSNAEKHLLFGQWVKQWEGAFSKWLVRAQPTMGPEDRKAAMILKAHHLVTEIFSEVDLSLRELGWDQFYDKWAAIVDLATAILGEPKQRNASSNETRWKFDDTFMSGPTPTLTFSMGIVGPLYHVCSRCRDPVIRRRALDLLAKHPQQECIWSSRSAWKIGQFLMRAEEEGGESPPSSSAEIPSERRIKESWLDFSHNVQGDKGPGRVVYKYASHKARPQYALTPGLFEDLKLEDSHPFAAPVASKVPSAAYSTPPEENDSMYATTAFESYDPTWLEFGEPPNGHEFNNTHGLTNGNGMVNGHTFPNGHSFSDGPVNGNSHANGNGISPYYSLHQNTPPED